MLDEEMVQTRVEMLYGPDRCQLRSHDYELFFLISAIGASIRKHPTGPPGQDEDLASKTYRQAWTLVQETMSTPSEPSLQVLLLHVSQ